LTQGISARVDADHDNWAIWIHDEDQLPQAIVALDEFRARPDAEKYRLAGQQAAALRQRQQHENQQRQRRVVEMRERWKVQNAGLRPLTFILIAVSALVSLATDFGSENNRVLQAVMFQSIPTDALGNIQFPSSLTQDIDQGQVWRLVTPIFLHFGPMHILMNGYAIFSIGSLVETRLGSVRYALLVLIVAILSNYGQYYFSFVLEWGDHPSIRFGGLSGVIFGLFGYLWMKSKFDPLFGIRISNNGVVFVLVWFALCWLGLFSSIANWAHTIGLITGMAIGYAPIGWRKLTHLR
jgi:GlpG protein